MKKLYLIFIGICLAVSLTGCGADSAATEEPTAQPQPSQQPELSAAGEESNMPKIEILIGKEVYSAALYDNASTKALLDRLPLTLDMSELNGNEKYSYLAAALPTNATVPSEIKAGDLMLYGDSCLVVFYENFSTSYSYTPLGYMDDPTGLAAALGNGSVQVTFSKGTG